MTDLHSKIMRRAALDEKLVVQASKFNLRREMAILNREHEIVINDFKDGARWEHARLKPLIEALAAQAKAHEALFAWAKRNHEMPGYSEVLLLSELALASLAGIVE